MKLSRTLLLTSAALLTFQVGIAHAETVKTTTVVSQQELPNVKKTEFMAFDLNRDGILSMPEVGQKLFYIFDTDGNEIIDNIEFDNKQVMTIIPMQEQTFTYVDYNNDGTADETTYTHETFIKKSGLMRFDEDMDGLSASDFIQNSFLELDDDNSKAIELEEWKEAYTEMTHPKAVEPERYN